MQRHEKGTRMFRGRAFPGYNAKYCSAVADSDRTHLDGRPAISMIREDIREELEVALNKRLSLFTWRGCNDPTLRLKNLLNPTTRYDHAAECFYGSEPEVKIQRRAGIFQSIYFKRCHCLYVNAFGETWKGAYRQMIDL
jgi:hypothetical protein